MTHSTAFPVPQHMVRPLAPVALAIDKVLLYEVIALLVPAWAIVGAGSPRTGAYWYYVLLAGMLLWHWAHKQPHRVSGLLLATIPAMGVFRNYFFYNSPQLFYLFALLLWAEFRRKEVAEMLRDRLVMGLMAFSVVYWWISFLTTDDYSANLRALELSLSVAGITLLYTELATFRTALLGVGIGILIQGAALMGYGERLGFATVGGDLIGNPISFGVPAALLFLLSIADNGRWIMVKDNPVWRGALTALSGIALLLSTSRGSWLMATIGLIVIFVFDKKQRPALILYLVLLVAVTAIFTQTEQGATLSWYLEKTFGGDVSMAKRTTGRAEQWEAFPHMLADSPLWGHGGGEAKKVAAQYAGRYLALHSLYLQIGAELGGIGLLLLAIFGVMVVKRGWFYVQKFNEPVPLLGGIAYFTVALSIPAIDSTTGMFLSLGLLRLRRNVFRVAAIAPQTAATPAVIDAEVSEPDPAAGGSWPRPESEGEEEPA